MSYTVRPISDRSRFSGKPRPSQFQSSWPNTEALLLSEVKHLKGRDIVIEIDVSEGGIRNDGRLRANAKPSSPAVRVAFESMYGPLSYATDRYSTWQDNVRAIALSLESLRRVDRYGVTKRGEQYTGWKALPSGSGGPASHMTADEAWSILGSFGERPVAEQRQAPDGLQRAYRRARAFAHPDRHDGDRTLWDQVEQAARLLGVA